jgi:hypothetical protein
MIFQEGRGELSGKEKRAIKVNVEYPLPLRGRKGDDPITIASNKQAVLDHTSVIDQYVKRVSGRCQLNQVSNCGLVGYVGG